MHPLDTLELASLFARYKHDRMSISTRSTSTTDTMDIRFWIMRDMIVDDESDIVEIESSRGYICSDKYTNLTRLKRLDRTDSISLHHITIDIRC